MYRQYRRWYLMHTFVDTDIPVVRVSCSENLEGATEGCAVKKLLFPHNWSSGHIARRTLVTHERLSRHLQTTRLT